MVCNGQGSGVLWDGEWKAMTEGTREKVWACRRSKAPLLVRVRVGGADGHRNLPVKAQEGIQRAGGLWCRLQVARSHLLRLLETERFLCRLLMASRNQIGSQ